MLNLGVQVAAALEAAVANYKRLPPTHTHTKDMEKKLHMGFLSTQCPCEPNTPQLRKHIVDPKKLETGLRTNSAGIPYTLLLRIEAIGFPTFGLLLYVFKNQQLHFRI